MENLITIQKYVAKKRLSTFEVIKQINSGKLQTIKKDSTLYILLNEDAKEPSIKDFNDEDEALFKEVLDKCEYGVLSLNDATRPYSVPLNFAYDDGAIIFHGANMGKKIALMKKNPNATFCVVKPYSLIPSYFFDSKVACKATQFFASIICEGKIEFIEDLAQKALMLNKLMQKLQPEGGYEKIEPAFHKEMLKKCTVYKLQILHVNTKFKAGQKLTKEKKAALLKELKKRANSLDLATIKFIEKFTL